MSEFLQRLSHRLRGHGRPRFEAFNAGTWNYRCPCGAYLWRTWL